MKKVSFYIGTVLCASISLVLTSCKDDDPTPVVPLQATTFPNLAADPIVSSGSGQPAAATGKYTFFSFKTGKVVPNSDSATANWDIGFRSTRIIFNGGSSGPGQAAVSLQTGLFDELKSVSDTVTFKTDNATTGPALTAASGKGWYNYNPATNLVTPIPGRVLVIRTADGKYAKMEVLSYYKDAPATPDATSTSRYYTFRYMYQPDGSKKLE
jgi:hypothetical protein